MEVREGCNVGGESSIGRGRGIQCRSFGQCKPMLTFLDDMQVSGLGRSDLNSDSLIYDKAILT